MISNDLYQRRSILAASISLVSCGGMTVNAHPVGESKELLLAIKRVVEEGVIDKPKLLPPRFLVAINLIAKLE